MKKIISENKLKKIIRHSLLRESIDQDLASLKITIDQELNTPEKIQNFKKNKAGRICKECIEKNKTRYTSSTCNVFCNPGSKIDKDSVYTCIWDTSYSIPKEAPDKDDAFSKIAIMMGCIEKIIGKRKLKKYLKN
jgi:hypothetical protein